MLQLSDNPQETLTNKVWSQWKEAGYTTRPYALTWMEINHLVTYFLQVCCEKNVDYQELDFITIIDHKLNFEENKSTIFESIGQPLLDKEAEALSELNDKLQEDYGITVSKKLKPTTDLEAKNKELEATNKRLENMLRMAEEAAVKARLTNQVKPIVKQIEQPLPDPPDPPAPEIYIDLHKPKRNRTQTLIKTAHGAYNVLRLAAWMIHHG